MMKDISMRSAVIQLCRDYDFSQNQRALFAQSSDILYSIAQAVSGEKEHTRTPDNPESGLRKPTIIKAAPPLSLNPFILIHFFTVVVVIMLYGSGQRC